MRRVICILALYYLRNIEGFQQAAEGSTGLLANDQGQNTIFQNYKNSFPRISSRDSYSDAAADLSLSSANVGGYSGGVSSGYGPVTSAPSPAYGVGSGGEASMYHYRIVPQTVATASTQYGLGDTDSDDDDDDDDDLLGGGSTQALCIAKILGLKGKKLKLFKKLKKLKKVLALIKFGGAIFPIILPLLLPLLLPILLPILIIPIILIALFASIIPIPIIQIPVPPQTRANSKDMKESLSRSFSSGKFQIPENLSKMVLESEECVERISCEIRRGAKKVLGKKFGTDLVSGVGNWIKNGLDMDKSPHSQKIVKRSVDSVKNDQSKDAGNPRVCEKYKCVLFQKIF